MQSKSACGTALEAANLFVWADHELAACKTLVFTQRGRITSRSRFESKRYLRSRVALEERLLARLAEFVGGDREERAEGLDAREAHAERSGE